MPCYYPLIGYRSRDVNPTGKRPIVFNTNQGFRDLPVELPCGQCIGCRLERSRQWAIRCVHESQLHEDNCFLTLTYSDEHLPQHNSLFFPDFQLFMKRLRRSTDRKIRFFHCGEYGEQFGRPHYHVCIFNYDFNDKTHHKTLNGNKLYVSQTLESLWTKGFSSIGDVTFESAAYVARYIMKKITGEQSIDHYNTINYQTGEILAERKPEYVTMSRRPGIGKLWFEKFKTDVYPDDFVVLRGKRLKPPKYYNAQYEMVYPSDYAKLKSKRIAGAKAHADNNTYERLRVREEVQQRKYEQLKRSLK